ncbi:MAG: trypsin-like peptidase domain-containing protein [Actinomycetota bacterium]
MNFQRTISAILSTTIPLSVILPSRTVVAVLPLQTSQMVATLTAPQVNTIAKEITVRIQGPKGGSGVLLEKSGSTYYILTNWHVVDQPGDYQVITPDGKRHSVYYSLIRRVPGVDLAVVPFSSSGSYRLAQLGNSSQVSQGKKVYVAGWPISGGSLRQPIFISTEGLVTRRQAPWNGYTLVYSNLVRSGMSGGPVLDSEGRLVAINGIVQLEGQSDRVVAAGIEIEVFVKWRSAVSLPNAPQQPTANGGTTGTKNPPPRSTNNSVAFSVASTLKGPSGVVSSVALTASHFVSGNSNGTISVWNLPGGELERALRGHTDAVNAVAIAPDGQMLASGSDDQTIKIWNLATGETIRTLKGHTDAVASVAIAPDGQILASGSWDKTIKVWNLKTGEVLRTLTGHAGLVNSVAVAPDGKLLASGSKDGSIKLWNLQTGQLIRTFSGNSLSVLSVAFSPDGKTLASGNSDGTIGVWTVATGQLLRRLSGHTDGVWSVAISRDGRTLVSGSWDKTIKLWDLNSGQLKGNLAGHLGYITSVAISGDGQMIVSGGWEGQIKIWKKSG